MASKAAQKRLMKEHADLQKSPPPFIVTRPKESDILEWHYIIRGPPNTPYEGGEYWGTVVFPSDYPFKPPGIKMLTPSGRFQPDRKICTSMSDYHPGSWNPAWSVSTILTGLLSFMVGEEITTGAVRSSDIDRRAFAQRSHAWNLAQSRFKAIFPDYCNAEPVDLPNMGDPRSLSDLKSNSAAGGPPSEGLQANGEGGNAAGDLRAQYEGTITTTEETREPVDATQNPGDEARRREAEGATATVEAGTVTQERVGGTTAIGNEAINPTPAQPRSMSGGIRGRGRGRGARGLMKLA